MTQKTFEFIVFSLGSSNFLLLFTLLLLILSFFSTFFIYRKKPLEQNIWSKIFFIFFPTLTYFLIIGIKTYTIWKLQEGYPIASIIFFLGMTALMLVSQAFASLEATKRRNISEIHGEQQKFDLPQNNKPAGPGLFRHWK